MASVASTRLYRRLGGGPYDDLEAAHSAGGAELREAHHLADAVDLGALG